MVFPATIANVYFFMSYLCVPAMIDATSPIIGNQGEKKITTAQPYLFIDRKSTRLNSSHGYISYAVFCLKKKKRRPCHDDLEAELPAQVGGRDRASAPPEP